MQRPQTLPAFNQEQKRIVHALLGAKVTSMMGRKLEEGDWTEIYCRAKNIPFRGWSNLNLDIIHDGLGIEHKMLCYRSKPDLAVAAGTRLMHPSATRSFRMPGIDTDPNQAMREVFSQYAGLIQARKSKVQETLQDTSTPELRTGWLLWQQSLRQFLYFEEEMIAPDPSDYEAQWISRQASGGRKGSTNLWVYEKASGMKRFSITNEAGAKIQPYFDVPPLTDPNLYLFTVIGELIDTGHVRVWVSDLTRRELHRLTGTLDTEPLSRIIITAIKRASQTTVSSSLDTFAAHPLVITINAYENLRQIFPAINDEHCFRMLIDYMSGASEA
jgi:hypothetical protein